MASRLKRVSLSLTGLALALGVLAGIAWWSIHTAWFADLVRGRIVSLLRDATGGRVELRGFDFKPDTLHARVTGLVVHGTEPSGPPLLSIDSVDVGLKILSIWRQNIDVRSLVINHPELHLSINRDGTTNIPTPRTPRTGNPIQQLFDLKIGRLSINQGRLHINDREWPVQLTSGDIGLLLDYNFTGPNYDLALRTGLTNLDVPDRPIRPMRMTARAHVFKDRAHIDALELITGDSSSTVELSGWIDHFARPLIHANLDVALSMDELAQLGGINDMLRNGRGTFNGKVAFNGASGQFTFDGKAQAHGVDFVSPEFTLRNMAADANMVANNQGILLHQAHGTAKGAHFAGEGSIKDYAILQVQGLVSNVALHEVGAYLTDSPFPWSGTAHGTAHASANLTGKDPDFIIGGNLDIQPGQSGIPASGNVEVAFHARGTKVDFGPSTLHLPHSTIQFNGALETDLMVQADTADLRDIEPVLPIIGSRVTSADQPVLRPGGSARFDGTLHDVLNQPSMQGLLSVNKFKFRNVDWDALSGRFTYSPAAMSVSRFQLLQSGARLDGKASVQLSRWFVTDHSPLTVAAHFSNFDVVNTAALFTTDASPIVRGVASGDINLQGTFDKPRGGGIFRISNLDAYGEHLDAMEFDAALDGSRLRITSGKLQFGLAALAFSGTYNHSPFDWTTGDLNLQADSRGFPLSGVSTVRKNLPALNGQAEIHLQVAGKVRPNTFEPSSMDGGANLSRLSLNGRELGDASIKAVTFGSAIRVTYSGNLRDTQFRGNAEARLTTGTPIHGSLQMDRIGLTTLKELFSGTRLLLPVEGYVDGDMAFDGLLEKPSAIDARATIRDLNIKSVPAAGALATAAVPQIVLHNNAPILLDIRNGELSVVDFEVDGAETTVKVTGSVPLSGEKSINLKAVGKADLALFTLFDANVRSSGSSELEANVTGTIDSPNVSGRLGVRNGSFFPSDLPNGLSDVNGTVTFSRNRATIEKMSGHSGGGDITLGGSLSFGNGGPLVYHLEAAARNVRIRYANSVSVTANSDVRLSGTSASSILSGTLTVGRIVFTPNADAGNLLAAASSLTSSPADPGNFISGLHLNVDIESAPNLQVSTNLSRDVEAELQLRLRGTPDHPILLGNITANQGDLKIFGTRFSLNRGEVNFVNTVRIEPVLDLDLETQARGVTVDITVSGTPSKLNFNYRSDPPLQPRDIIALLTVGRAPGLGSASNSPTGSDVGALTSGVNSVLGQAISPVSNRLSKLFGITNIKIDPFVQGITNTPQARLSVEQQISRNVTITYVTNLSQTSEQIFRFEWALSHQFSIVALRDDNGEFGIDFQYKKRFK